MRQILFLFLCTYTVACTPTAVLQNEQDAVRAVWDASVAAALAGDYDAWATDFSDDIEIVNPDVSMRLQGRRDVEKVYRRAFENTILFTDIDTKRFDVKVSPRGDFAWGTAVAEVTAGGEKTVSWYALVFEKVDGSWKMVLGYNAAAK